jgi:hypothetical protein
MLVVHGSDVDASAAAQAPKLPNPTAQQAAAIAHSYQLTDSEADLSKIPPATIVAENTSVHCEGGTGDLGLELNWSNLTVVDRDGTVRLASLDSEITLERLSGPVEFEMERGGLRLVDGAGTVQGRNTEGYVTANGRDGALTLTGSDASFEVRDGSTGQLKIVSSESISIIDNIRGHVNLDAIGGQVSMDSVQGNLTATISEGGQLTNDTHYGAISLNLKDEAYGEVNRSQSTLKAHVSWAELRVNDAKSLDLTAESSRATLGGIRQLAGFDVRDSEVELDLTLANTRKLTLHVGDGSAVEVLLTSPCQVQVRESAIGGSGINVTGCQLQMERAGRMKRGRISVDDGRRPFWLIAKVAETGTLRVHGGS